MSSLMGSKHKYIMKQEANFNKLLKQVTFLLLSQADRIKLIGCSLFKGEINKDEITIRLLTQAKLLSKNKQINTFTPLPYKSNRKIKNHSEKKEIEKMRRSIVALRRLEYEKNLKLKTNSKLQKYIYIQRYWKDYFYNYYLPHVEMIQKNIRMYLKKKNKKISYEISYAQLELFYKNKNLISIGIQADIKRQKTVVTISSLYSKNVLSLLTKNENKKIFGLRCFPHLKITKEIDQKANRKHFKSSYISIQTSSTDAFSLYQNDKASDTVSIFKKNIHSPSSTNLFTNDTTIRSFRREASFISRLVLKRKKKPLYMFNTKKYYSKKEIDSVDMKIRRIQRFIREHINYDKVNDEERIVVYNNDDKLNKWISKITVQSTRKVYMGELKKKKLIRNKKKILTKVKGEQVFITKENIKRKERKNGIKEIKVISLIKRSKKYKKEDNKENLSLLKILVNCLFNKASFISKVYAFDILLKAYKNNKKEERIKKEYNEIDNQIHMDISKEKKIESIHKDNSITKDTESNIIPTELKVMKSGKPINQKRNLVPKKGDERINHVNDINYRTKSTDRSRQISIKLIKKDKKHRESMPSIDIDTILNSHPKNNSGIEKILLTSYMDYLSLNKKVKRNSHMHTISNIEVYRPNQNNYTSNIKSSKSNRPNHQKINRNQTQSMTNKELENLYKGIYSVRKDNPLYMLKKRNQSRPKLDNVLQLRDEMTDNIL